MPGCAVPGCKTGFVPGKVAFQTFSFPTISDIIVHNIVEKMCQQYDTLPLCHLEKIVRKYVNCRLQRWGKFQNKELTTKNKAVIFSEAHSSRSTAAQVTIH